jgi:hypothetical protein
VSKTPTRIYVVTDTLDNSKYLVRAASAAQAIRHCANHYRADVASQDDLVKLVAGGVDVETAGEEAAQPNPVNQSTGD